MVSFSRDQIPGKTKNRYQLLLVMADGSPLSKPKPNYAPHTRKDNL
jgi:hypothetical protein